MFIWIKKPEGICELEEKQDKTTCGQGDTGHLWTCDSKATLQICEKRKAPTIDHGDVVRDCVSEGSLSACEGKGTLHMC